MSGEDLAGAVAGSRRLLRASRTAMLTALGIDALGSGLYLPLSLLYFTLVVGLPLRGVGFALSAATTCVLPVPLLAGACADRFGARRVVVISQLFQGLGFCAYLFVRDTSALFGAALLVGVGERAYWSTVFTFIAETSAGRKLDGWYARASVARSLGLGSGTLLAGAVVGSGSHLLYQIAIIANAASFAVAAMLLGLAVAEAPSADGTAKPTKPIVPKGGYRLVLKDRSFVLFTATNLAYSLCLTTVVVALPVYVVKGLAGPGWLAGILFAVNTGLIFLAQSSVTKSVATHRRTRVLIVAGALWVVWALAMAASPHVPHAALIPFLTVGMLLFTVSEMMQSPTSTALAAAASVDDLRGRYMALYQYGYQIAKIIAPVLFTQLYVVGKGVPWLLLAAVAACAIPGLLLLEKSLPAKAVRPEAPVDQAESAPVPSRGDPPEEEEVSK